MIFILDSPNGRNVWLVITILLATSYPLELEAHEAKDFDDTILYKIDFEMPDFDKHPEFQNQLQPFHTHEKEKYECVIPVVEDVKEENKVSEHELGPFELLNPFFTASSCSYRIEAYWSYEICHGHYVRQYHEERDGKNIKFQEYYLGQFSEEMNKKMMETWKENQKAGIKYKTTKIDNTKYPYFEVEMTGGTMCDIINSPRTTVVRYVCYPHGKNEIYSFKETSSCTYEAIILTSVLCMIPAFHAEESKEVSIKCFNSPTDTHKPLSMLRQELGEMQMNLDDFPAKESHASALTQSATQPSGDRYVFLNKFGADVDKLVLELMAGTGVEVDSNGLLTQEAPGTDPNDVLTDAMPHQAAMQPIKDFISGKNCLTGGNGWWKYEFCYGRHVRQFHKDKKSEVELYLGYFSDDSHRKWVIDNPSKGAKRAGYSSSLWHHYEKGTMCDRTGHPREVDVKLTCTAAAGSATSVSMYLLEPKTCQYILVVESPVVCALISLADEYGLVDDEKLQQTLDKEKFKFDDVSADDEIRTTTTRTKDRDTINPIGATGSVSEAVFNADNVHV